MALREAHRPAGRRCRPEPCTYPGWQMTSSPLAHNRARHAVPGPCTWRLPCLTCNHFQELTTVLVAPGDRGQRLAGSQSAVGYSASAGQNKAKHKVQPESSPGDGRVFVTGGSSCEGVGAGSDGADLPAGQLVHHLGVHGVVAAGLQLAP